MRYVGGKSRDARAIAAIIAPRGRWWDPFCGGLSVSVELARFGPGIVSDVNPALIALYRAVRDGWEPPESLSRDEWQAARSLPDSDPRKAFAGFGCSFRGKWFAGYQPASATIIRDSVSGPRCSYNDPAAAGGYALRRDVPKLAACDLRCADFFEIRPGSLELDAIYCDPPYRGTLEYGACAPFDHAAFWARCREWADAGVRVYVSELSAPADAPAVWSRARTNLLSGPTSQPREERLFVVPPSAASQAAE